LNSGVAVGGSCRGGVGVVAPEVEEVGVTEVLHAEGVVGVLLVDGASRSEMVVQSQITA